MKKHILNKTEYFTVFFFGVLIFTSFSFNETTATNITSSIEEEHVLNSNTKIEGFTISNDGELIALADIEDTQIEVYSLNGIKQENLPLPEGIFFTGESSGIQFYRNTSELFFVGNQEVVGEESSYHIASLYRIFLSNHTCRLVAPGIRFFRISPDEQNIVFSANDDYIEEPTGEQMGEFSSIYVMDVDGSNIAKIKHVTGTTFLDFDWNSEGNQILVEGWDGPSGFWTMNVDGSDFLRITALGLGTENPMWSLENDFIFCTGQDGSLGGFGIEFMAANGDNRTTALPDLMIAELVRHPTSNYVYYTALGEYSLNRVNMDEILHANEEKTNPFGDFTINGFSPIVFGLGIAFTLIKKIKTVNSHEKSR
jgi:WD40 repeat protein